MVACTHVDRFVPDWCTHRSGTSVSCRTLYLYVVLGHPMLKQFWQRWKRLARAVGTFQARVLLTVFYVVLVLPFGIVVRLVSDPLRIKRRPTQWLESPAEAHHLPWS